MKQYRVAIGSLPRIGEQHQSTMVQHRSRQVHRAGSRDDGLCAAKQLSFLRLYKENRLAVIAAGLLLKGLLIVLAASFYMHSRLFAATAPEIKACVRRFNNQCQVHPCEERDGVATAVAKRIPNFGYAGNFVHRVNNSTKPLPQTLGDTGWASGCILSDEYKFVFIHVLKSGGTAVKKFIKDSLCGPDDSECEQASATLVRAEGCIKAIRDHQEYFHFSFVRSPYSRLYSAYSMMDGFPPANGIRGRLPTQDLSFEEFVLQPYKRELHSSIHAGHYDTQESFLFSEEMDECPMFDFLGRIEHFDEDMRRVLTHLNATKMLDYLDSIGGKIMSANSWGSDKKKARGGLEKEYSSLAVMGRVASDYRKDFRLLGYNPYKVPES
ncbi:hypothetical protein ACHAXT_010190 [Thalassiosira profunda]